jgi:hypothetical protein
MKQVTIGGIGYRITATARDGEWCASALRSDTGEPFGIACCDRSEASAVARVIVWLDWQHEHQAALVALQQAERAYHRLVAGSAFGAGGEAEVQKESLELVEAARLRLDEVRARRPE